MLKVNILIFAKYPQAGQVKTRLVPPLSLEQAAQWHEAALRVVCERTACFIHNQTDSKYTSNVILVGAPDSQLTSFRHLHLTGVDEYWPQGTGDLGERLARAVNQSFMRDTDAVVILGADSPTLPLAYLGQSLSLLETHDAVMVPTHDGGYCLLSLRHPCPALFEKIDWGTSTVADQTRCQASLSKCSLAELSAWYDIDNFDDVKKMSGAFDVDPIADLESTIALYKLSRQFVEQVS